MRRICTLTHPQGVGSSAAKPMRIVRTALSDCFVTIRRGLSDPFTPGDTLTGHLPPERATSTPCTGGMGCLVLMPPFFDFLPPKVPPDCAGTWQTPANAIERQTRGFHRGKEKDRTLLKRYGLVNGARDRNRTGTPVIHEAADFKSDVSTYFTTRAQRVL